MALLLSIDAGTTSVKVALFEASGTMVASSLQEYKLLTASGDRVELPAQVYWHSAVAGIREVLAQVPAGAEEILAVGVTSQGETVIPVDEGGHPIRNAIVWLDNRAGTEARAIASVFDIERFYEITGQPEIIPTWSAPKILWLRAHEPGVFTRAHKFLLVEDYLITRLSGLYVSEGGVCSSTGYFDIRSGAWWGEMTDYIGLRPEQLPELLGSGQVVGPITPQAARETGLSPETLVVTGSMDQIAGAVGAGNILPGVVSEMTGTALVLATTVNQPTYDPKRRFPCYYHAFPGRYVLVPYCQTAGMAFRWFRDQFGDGQNYEQLTAEAAGISAGSDGLIMLPHLAGSSSPISNPGARGVFYGITLQHTRAHFVRALLESVAFMLREHVGLLEELGVEVEEIVSLGGGARSSLWLQIKADVTGLPLRTLECDEAACLGVAILAATAVGLYPDLETACQKMVRTGTRTQPDPAHRALYDAAYDKYGQLFKRLQPVFGDGMAA